MCFQPSSSFRPKIEVLDDGSDNSSDDDDDADDGKRDECNNTGMISSPAVKATGSPVKRLLIEEVSTAKDAAPSNQASAVSPSRKVLIEEVSSDVGSSAVEEEAEVASPTPRSGCEDTVSLNEVVLEARRDQDSEDLMQGLSVMLDFGASKSGVLDMSKLPVTEGGAAQVSKLLSGGRKEKEAGGEEEVVLGELD